MKYLVSGKKVVTTSAEIEVEAETRDAAVLAFVTQHPEMNVEFISTLDDEGEEIDGWEVIGQDEATGEFIFSDDEYFTANEGDIMFLERNWTEEEKNKAFKEDTEEERLALETALGLGG